MLQTKEVFRFGFSRKNSFQNFQMKVSLSWRDCLETLEGIVFHCRQDRNWRQMHVPEILLLAIC